MAKIVRRDICPFLKNMRAFFLGRELLNGLRFADGLSKRTQPPPKIPRGPAHILSANPYYKRDYRRFMAKPVDVLKQKSPAAASTKKSQKDLPTPGNKFQWD